MRLNHFTHSLFLKKIILAGFLASLMCGAVLIPSHATVQASAGPQTVNPLAVQTPAPQNAPGVREVRTALEVFMTDHHSLITDPFNHSLFPLVGVKWVQIPF